MKETLAALARDGRDDDSREILAPAVGKYLEPPPVGTYLRPGAFAGFLRVLAKTYRVTTPEGVHGVVADHLAPSHASVEFGAPLLAVSRGALLPGDEEEGAGAEAAAEEGIPDGALAVRAQTDGIFYRRPSPEDPPYVTEGEEIEAGKVLGLIEVMKCFNQIHWRPEPDAPPRVKVLKVAAGDSADVREGEILFLLEEA